MSSSTARRQRGREVRDVDLKTAQQEDLANNKIIIEAKNNNKT